MKISVYTYYCCTGTDSARFGGTKMCNAKQVGANAIELVVWGEVKKLLKNPQRIFDEYQRRLTELEQSPMDHTYASIEKQRIKLERGMSLLIDSYAQQYIIKDEFEPRIKAMRQNLKVIQDQQNKLTAQKKSTKEMELIVTNLENFSCGIGSELDSLEWSGKRDIIRRVVKRIEISGEEINIVYKINKLPGYENDTSAQHCCNRMHGSYVSCAR